MYKGKIVIIEDEFFAAEHLSDLVQTFGFSVEGIYHSGESFLKETDWQFDAAIVDIFLSEELTGLDLAIHLNEKQKPYLFLTANQDPETLKKAAKLYPASYLSKPFKSNDVEIALVMISNQIPPKISIKTINGTQNINPNDILFIKSDGSYIEIYTEKERIVQRKLLKEIETELPNFFIKTHRSYLVNKNYIKQKTSTFLFVNEFEIPISRSYK